MALRCRGLGGLVGWAEREAEAQRCAKRWASGAARVSTSLRTAILLLAVLLGNSAHAQPEALYLRTLAANCAQCHGTNGHTAPGAALPSIAGMPRDYLLTQLHAFKAGTRPSTIMQQLARGYSEAQLEQLAAFFAAQKP